MRISSASAIASTPPSRYQMLFVSTGMRYSLTSWRKPNWSVSFDHRPWRSGDGGVALGDADSVVTPSPPAHRRGLAAVDTIGRRGVRSIHP